MKSIKTAPKSITFNPSKTVAQRLEQLGRISQLSHDQILNDIVGSYLDDVFGDCPDTDLLASHVVGRAHPSQENAQAIADAYNAFSLSAARELKQHSVNQATVVKNSRGISYVQVQLSKPLKETTRRAVAA